MAITITSNTVSQVVVTFWVKEDTNSPYQGILYYGADAYATMTPTQVEADQMAQYNSWKANLIALQASANTA